MAEQEQTPEIAVAITESAVEAATEVKVAEANSVTNIEVLTQQLEEARVKAEQHWNQLLRMKADMENLHKRQAREVENAHKFALDNFVRELIQVWDSLEMGLVAAAAPDADVAKLQEGTALTMKMFADVMNKFGVQRLDPLGQPFNPDYHQAMSMLPREDMEPNRVAMVMQKGCTLNGRLVRPALVIVSTAPIPPAS